MSKFKKVVVINGPARSGKDTFISMVGEVLSDRGIDVFNYSAVDQVKEWAKMLGWDGNKDDKGRKLLYDLKMVSVKYNDGPTKYLTEKVSEVIEGVIFLHIREPEEIQKIKEVIPNIVLLHLERPQLEQFVNGADDRTMEIEYDYYVVNDKTEKKLFTEAKKFIEWLTQM